MRYTIITKSKEAARARRKSTLPHLFGRGGRDRALICLNVNGPMTVRELGRAIKSDSSKTFRMMQVLLDAGIAVKCEIAGSRKYVALNTRLPVYRELVSLLNALDALWPAPREDLPGSRVGKWIRGKAPVQDWTDSLFQSAVRAPVLLYVAAVGMTDMEGIYNTLGMGSVSVMYAVNHWERQGVITTAPSGRHRLVFLNAQFPVFPELEALLKNVVALDTDLRRYRDMARGKSKRRSGPA